MGESRLTVRTAARRAVRCDDILRYHMEICGPSGHWCELTLTFAFRPLGQGRGAAAGERADAPIAPCSAAARPGARARRARRRLFEGRSAEDGWELGEPTQHFDFHGQGMDVIEFPWFAAEQPWGGSRDAELEPGPSSPTIRAERSCREPAWSPGVSDNLLISETAAEWLSGDWSHEWREGRA